MMKSIGNHILISTNKLQWWKVFKFNKALLFELHGLEIYVTWEKASVLRKQAWG